MKGLLALVLVLVLGWLGATWYVGMRAEEMVRSEVSNLSLLPGRDDIVLDVVRYDRGLFSSEADTCLVIQGDLAALAGGADLTGTLCMNSTIYHGPLIFADGVALGLAATRDAFDVSALPPSGKAVLEEIFKGRAPLEGRSFYGFDGSLTATLEMPRWMWNPRWGNLNSSSSLSTWCVPLRIPTRLTATSPSRVFTRTVPRGQSHSIP